MFKHVIGCLFLLFSFFSFTQLEEGKRIVQELCSEKYVGRGYIKSGDSLAAEFIAKEFEKRNLQKLNKSWFQSFYFDVNTFPSEMKLTFDEKTLVPGKDFIVDPASSSVNITWRYQYLGKTELFDESYIEKTVRKLHEEKEWNSLVIDTRNISGDSLKKVKSLQMNLAQMCHVMSLTDEKFTFSVSSEQLPFGLIYVKGNSFAQGALIQSKIESVLKKNHHARNVIARLPAKKKTKKTILITAHYDHLGGMGNQTYFPGGNDNASGTSMLLTLADEFQKNSLKYNMVFIAFAAEEAGLLGSKYFVENPLLKLKNIQFVLNLDIMGSGEEGITVVNATVFPELFEKLNTINEKNKFVSQIKKRGKASNSDHYWFSEKDIPAFFIYTMGPNKNYHDIFDTFEALSFNKYEDFIKLISNFLRLI